MTAKRRTALVTGASQGIGAAIAVALARDGFDVAVSSTDPAKLAGVMAEIRAAGGRAAPVALDLRSQPGIEKAMADAVAALGGIEVLVNNAAVPLKKPALEVTAGEWEMVVDTGLTGTFFMSQQMGGTGWRQSGPAASSASPPRTAWWRWRGARSTASPRRASCT